MMTIAFGNEMSEDPGGLVGFRLTTRECYYLERAGTVRVFEGTRKQLATKGKEMLKSIESLSLAERRMAMYLESLGICFVECEEPEQMTI